MKKPVKVRQTWKVDPVTKVHESRKRVRQQEDETLKKLVDEALLAMRDKERSDER